MFILFSNSKRDENWPTSIVTTFKTTILIVPEIENAFVKEYTPKKEMIPDKVDIIIILKSQVNSVTIIESIIKIVILIIVRWNNVSKWPNLFIVGSHKESKSPKKIVENIKKIILQENKSNNFC